MQSDEERICSEFKSLQESEDNQRCCDCQTYEPQWGCITHGIFLCLQCAGAHRSMGSQVSIVRSIRMDTWDDFQLTMMKLGGNQKFADFMSVYSQPDQELSEKYRSIAAEYYRKALRAQALGEPFDEEPPRPEEGTIILTPEGDQCPQLDSKPKANNKVKAAFIQFGEKMKKGAQNFSEKPKVVQMKQKTEQFFQKVNTKVLETVHKTKESKAFIKLKEGSNKAFKGMANFTKKTIEKMKKGKSDSS